MIKCIISILFLSFIGFTDPLSAADAVDLAKKFKHLPTVPEDELPELDNKRADFRGKIYHDGLKGNTWVAFPFVENPGSFGFDRKGRLFVAETNRFWLGVPDLRGANEMIRDDFKLRTVADRLKMYDKFKANFPEGWFDTVADRIIRLEDRDNNGAADHRTLFSDHFNQKEDGIGFSVLADEDGTVYFTCIPNVWKITDTDDDGKADAHEVISTGYGVRVSFIGHDLHGIIRGPDGMLYFSIGDRSYNITDGEGNNKVGDGWGAIFRCESDGTGLEVYCEGLRNPQELAFDDFGNLFTFDNTGDIGDEARFVYALQGTDSGWNMAHQSPHQYASSLDWGDFRPEDATWISEKMFTPHNTDQPQWIYPTAGQMALTKSFSVDISESPRLVSGPSGATYLTGESLPENLRNKFIMNDYRGDAAKSATIVIGHTPHGAGYIPSSVEELVSGVAASDVELGYDGKIYLCDFGGGWAINTNGSIQVIEPTDSTQREAGEKVARLFKEGFDQLSLNELVVYLGHADRRVRQAAQFELVKKEGGAEILMKAAATANDLPARLHAVWGLGQILRNSGHNETELVNLLEDPEDEIRANVVRVLGDNRFSEARDEILNRFTTDSSIRVRSLAAIALGRVSSPGDTEVIEALYKEAVKNGQSEQPDIVLRHALLTALDQVGTEVNAVAMLGKNEEARLLAVLYLRRKASPKLIKFLNDESDLIRREVVRAIYDTKVLESDSGMKLAALEKIDDFPKMVQRRIMAANYRLGKPEHGKRLIEIAGDAKWDSTVRKAALQGLLRWEKTIETDPVLGTYRPVSSAGRSMASLGSAIGIDLQSFLSGEQPPELVSLAIQLADASGVKLPAETLHKLSVNEGLDSGVRVAALNSLVETNGGKSVDLVKRMLESKTPEVQAAALRLAYGLKRWDLDDRAVDAIVDGPIPVARAAINGLSTNASKRWSVIWRLARDSFRPELKLDAYLATKKVNPDLAATLVSEHPHSIFNLSEAGGDPVRGELVYLNQGGCRQCHKIGGDGGEQGPPLTKVAKRLSPKEILTSVYDPGLVIAPGFGMTNATLKDGTSVVGRLAKENKKQVTIIAPDGKVSVIKRSEIASLPKPISPMPPMGAMLPPNDLRDLVAFLVQQTGNSTSQADTEAHGDEAIAK